MSCQVSDLIRTLPEVPVEEISTFVRQKCAELDRKYLDFADDLRFAESRVKVSSTLTPYINEVANQLGIIRFLAGGLSRLNPHEGESQTYYTQLVRQLPAVADSLNTLEVEARVIFAEALGSSVPESAHRLVRISEHTGSPSESLLQSVQGMMREWVIDPSLKRPQYGFGRVHTLKELRDYLVTYKGRLFQVQAEGRDVGYYILFSDLQDFPPEVKEIIEAVGRTGEYLKVKQGWTQLVGVTKAGRDWAKRNGVDLYTIIHEAVVDTFSSFQVEKAFCIVRDGEFANLALDSHLNPKRGWRRTGATVQLGQFPYQILRFDVSPGGTN
jgi:hypothetical protein